MKDSQNEDAFKTIVLGASGFIGKKLIDRLGADSRVSFLAGGSRRDAKKEIGTKAHSLTLDYRDEESLTQSFAQFDIVFDARGAGNPGSSNRSIPEELQLIQDNARVIDACSNAGVKKYIFLSSGGAVYGKGQELLKETDDVNPITTYGLVKLTTEKLLHLYNQQTGLDYRIARLANPYGPGQRTKTGQGVIAAFIDRALSNSSIEMYGDGNVTRDFIYIDDAVDCLVDIAFYDGKQKIFNVGSGSGTTIGDLAQEIIRLTGSSSRISYNKGRSVDTEVNVLSMQRYFDEIGQKKFRLLNDGLMATIEYYKRETSLRD
ncbi:NAD-dependent epimerase/dehydratase family protein [Anaerotardibacter muris]|uniref:NAD-dependent epimerase/dehydratase family protein n=1 Tax=Anaerotardibacter muris TaxID=2941505 RepID=UPI00203C6A1B|nr:NAD-dependent epimerase/dehydratase family protein [Anaerotardibacter muris]